MKAIVEGLLFLSGEDGLTLEEIVKLTEKSFEEVKSIIRELYTDYTDSSRGIQIEFLGNHFKLTTKKEHKEYYKRLLIDDDNSYLSQSALETLAIIAYNAPLTRIEIDNIRGINSSYVLRKLLLKGLVEEVGRSDAPGKPRIYNVTSRFLDYFGLGSLDELPRLQESNIEDDDDKNLFESKYKEDTNL